MGTLALSDRRGFRLLAHTADIGLEASASSREELFVTAAEGFTMLVFGAAAAKPAIHREIRVEAPDLAALLVVWLNEILYLCESASLVPAGFAINALTDHHLNAVISGEPFDPERHTIERTAKAVTYHQLLVEERKSGWYARVYIDL
jgi:SHS2 domain-containing protein